MCGWRGCSQVWYGTGTVVGTVGTMSALCTYLRHVLSRVAPWPVGVSTSVVGFLLASGGDREGERGRGDGRRWQVAQGPSRSSLGAACGEGERSAVKGGCGIRRSTTSKDSQTASG